MRATLPHRAALTQAVFSAPWRERLAGRELIAGFAERLYGQRVQ